jgi:hypothetical protein
VRALQACLPPPDRPATAALTFRLAALARRAAAQGVAASEAKKKFGLTDACLRGLQPVKVRPRPARVLAVRRCAASPATRCVQPGSVTGLRDIGVLRAPCAQRTQQLSCCSAGMAVRLLPDTGGRLRCILQPPLLLARAAGLCSHNPLPAHRYSAMR